MKKGGISATPMRIARYVDPQMTYTAAKAAANCAREAADAGDPASELSFASSGMILDAGIPGGTEWSQKYAIAAGWSRAILEHLIIEGQLRNGGLAREVRIRTI